MKNHTDPLLYKHHYFQMLQENSDEKVEILMNQKVKKGLVRICDLKK